MAYATDYNTTVTYNTSVIITMSAVSNVIADLLVAHAGFTLVNYATEGSASSASNYAQVSIDDICVRIYGTSTVAYTIGFFFYYSGSSSYINSSTFTLPSIASTSVSVSLRMIPTLNNGTIAMIYQSNSKWNVVLAVVTVQKISTGTESTCLIYQTENGGVAVPVANGLKLTYYHQFASLPSDLAETKQVLTNGGLRVTSGSAPWDYLIKNVYGSYTYIMRGFISVGGRYFFAIGYFAFEISGEEV